MKDLYLDRINTARDEKRMSLKALAEKTGYTDSTLCRYLNGKSTPTVEALRTICNALDLNYDEIAAEIGTQELKAAQNIDHAGTQKLIEKYDQIIAIHEKNYDRAVNHLKKQLTDLAEENGKLVAREEAALAQSARMEKYARRIFWTMLALCFAMLGVGVAIYPPWAL